MASIRKRSWRTARGEQRDAWQVDFTDQNGKRHQPQFARRKDADAWLVRARGQVQQGVFTPDASSITVAEAAELWLERCERDGLERTTMTQYRSHVTYHIGPLLGAVKLSRLTRPMAEQFTDQMLAGGRSRALTRKVLTSLRSTIYEAMRRGLCAQNVAVGVKLKTVRRHKGKVKIPTKHEVRALLDKVTGRARVLLLVAVFTGLRASEIRGLPWRDVDFQAGVVRVRQRADISGKLGALKSETSRRDVPMVPELALALKEWRLASGAGDGLVFPARGGGPICHNTVAAVLGRAHRFRHFFASWLIDQGFGPKRVQALMGHHSVRLTLDTYTHLWPQEDDHAKFAAAERELIG
jgi:integrase